MILNNLKPIYNEIKNNKMTYGVFPFTKNSIVFDIFFDIGEIPFRIGFLTKNSRFQFWKNVSKNFYLKTFLSVEDYKGLCKTLKLEYDPNNPFSSSSFFEDFNNRTPQKLPKLRKQDIRVLINKAFDIEESNKIYYCGQKDWSLSNSGKHRTKNNLEKTRLLCPGLYQQIKEKDISVLFTSEESRKKAK